MGTRYHQSYLADGCWSPTRPGLFFVARRDGWVDLWDFYHRQNEIALSHKVSDVGLTCMKLNAVTGMSQASGPSVDVGKFCAIGDADETVTLLKLCKSLYRPQTDERSVINEIFERERTREEMLKKQKLEGEVRRNLALKEKEKKDRIRDSQG